MATNITALQAVLMPSAFQIAQPGSYVEIGYASTAFMVVCSALVMVMTPAVGLLYSGLTRSKNALTMVMLSFLCYSVVALQWFIWGYSLAFSETGSVFYGDFANGGLFKVGVLGHASAPNIPAILFCLYQMQFACVTASLIFGAVTDRIRLIPSIIFIFCWTTLVYDPIAYWYWAPKGWLKVWGALDFAGGGPVHMSAGFSALAFCIFIGHRKSAPGDNFRPHNMPSVFLGTALLWFGWFGFNGGSALAATPRAAMAAFVTTLAASCGSLSWTLVEYFGSGKLSGLAFCSGAIAGLICITPAAGFVHPWAAVIIGLSAGVACCYAIRLKGILGYDDALDVFGLHGVGGFLGLFWTGIFASKDLVFWMDGSAISGGAIDRYGNLLGYNLVSCVAVIAWSMSITMILLYAINFIPGLHFRQEEEDEFMGGDLGEMGEVAYTFGFEKQDQ